MTKFLLGSVFLILVMLTTNAVTPVAANSLVGQFLNGNTFFEGCEVITDGGNLNVRSSARAGAIIGKLPNGHAVDVLERWVKINGSVNGRRIAGWASEQFLFCDETENTCTVNTEDNNLNVRTAPQTGAIVGKLPKGKSVELIERWFRVSATVNGRRVIGWASSQFIGNCGE